MNRLTWAVLFFAGCGITVEEEAGVDERVGVLRQAGKTDQGKTDQGKTDQGKTDQGQMMTRLVINRGSWRVRQGSTASYTTNLYGDLALESSNRPGTRLIGRSGSTSYAVSTTSYIYDQDGSWRYNLYTGTWVQNGQPLAYFYGHEVNTYGSFGPLRELRVVNTMMDNGPYNSAGFSDSANLLSEPYRTQLGANSTDIRFYKVQIKNQTDPNRWDDLCQATGPGNKAIFMPGYFDWSGDYQTNPQFMGVTCWDGTAAKCMRWGYRPWRSLTHPTSGPQSLDPLWRSCVRAARADYCGNGTSFTDNGKQIDIWDRYSFIAKTPESTRWVDSSGRAEAYSDESAFDEDGAVCLVRERLYSYDFASAQCPMVSTYLNGGEYCTQPTSGGSWSSCGPKGVVSSPTNIFDRGSLSTCDVVATRPPLVYVASYDSGCSTHGPTETGRALGADCNCVTKYVCSLPGRPQNGKMWGHYWRECCAEDADGHLIDGKWDAQCANKAAELLAQPNAEIALCPIDTVQ